MAEELTGRNVIENAISYMGEHGWCRNSLRDEAGRVCLDGALCYGSGLTSEPAQFAFSETSGLVILQTLTAPGLEAARKALRDAMEDVCPDVMGSYVDWNDDYCKDEADALGALKRALDRV